MRDLRGQLLLVGCGKMGGALLEGWLGGGLAAGRVFIVEPYEAAHAALEAKGCRCFKEAAALPADLAPDVVLFAIKPQMMAAALPHFASFAGPDTVFLSIAAGTTIRTFEEQLGSAAIVVRAMPNTPAAVGRGMTVLVANAGARADQRQLCEDLLAAVGETEWVDEEGLIDAVTGVSGSGPAYVFHMIECMAAAGEAAGLPAALAMKLARTTVAGAGELVHLSEEPAAQLRRNVTSPNGTTQAALEVLMESGEMKDLMIRAVAAATRRSRELSG